MDKVFLTAGVKTILNHTSEVKRSVIFMGVQTSTPKLMMISFMGIPNMKG